MARCRVLHVLYVVHVCCAQRVCDGTVAMGRCWPRCTVLTRHDDVALPSPLSWPVFTRVFARQRPSCCTHAHTQWGVTLALLAALFAFVDQDSIDASEQFAFDAALVTTTLTVIVCGVWLAIEENLIGRWREIAVQRPGAGLSERMLWFWGCKHDDDDDDDGGAGAAAGAAGARAGRDFATPAAPPSAGPAVSDLDIDDGRG